MSAGSHLSASLSAMEDIVAALIHPDAAMSSEARARHQRFLATHILAGLAALTALPVYLMVSGAPSTLEAIAFACLLAPLGSAFALSRTGRLDWAHAISSCALALLIAAVASASGGLTSPALAWLVVVPVEALLCGSRRTVIVAAVMALVAAAAVATLHALGLVVAIMPWNPLVAGPFVVVSAIAYTAVVVVEAGRRENARVAAQTAGIARTRIVLETIDDLFTWHDQNGAILFASPAAERMLGVSPKSLNGQGLFERVHVSDRPAYLKAVTDVANGAEATSVQFRVRAERAEASYQRKNPSSLDDARKQEIRWLEMRARRVDIPIGDGFRNAVIGVTRDVTERIHYQEELAAAKIAAEEASASKGHFLATVSHELRTPLNAIIGFSEILSRDDLMTMDAGRRSEYARIIHASGRHLNEVVGTLIDMSKIETGNFDFRPDAFDPVELAHSCCDLMQLEADQARVTLVREIAPEQAEVVADRRALKQIILNLVSNAIKFTPVGGSVAVAIEQTGKRFTLRVVDDGIGIAERDLEKLGRPFFQARSSYDRPYEGTGLGLSVVRGLVGLHGGAMTIESAPGAGTIVTVSMPLDCSGAIPSDAKPAIITAISRPRELSHDNGDGNPSNRQGVKRRA